MKALIIHPPKGSPLDLREIINIGSAEAKKAFRLKKHLNVVDLIQRPYGIVIVVDVPEKSGRAVGGASGVRGRTRK